MNGLRIINYVHLSQTIAIPFAGCNGTNTRLPIMRSLIRILSKIVTEFAKLIVHTNKSKEEIPNKSLVLNQWSAQ